MAAFDGRTEPDADGLRLTTAPLVPEIRLYLADDPHLLWARLEAAAGEPMPAPFWASAWPGGQVLSRFVLDDPSLVLGRRVLDLGCGGGIAAIAAAMAGASSVIGNDIDPCAALAARANAAANRVELDVLTADLLDGAYPLPDVDLVLVGDALYSAPVADRVLRLLSTYADRDTQVLIGDPGRGWLPVSDWTVLSTYPPALLASGEDAQLTSCSVLSSVSRASRAAV
jgi:predicted nicotinamide N-methyase